ncbi:cobalamin B12-binding domain-containing protein [Kutzneria kofuensis]|uniref:Methanogenic corrinoid protein MtbC1 n=1 Tax=Kutzneria kofuensis TaxID=103725 RepID=A0A7W9NHR3_9PSEU|nr:cobalamin-dependent protein [Kutzneria kofuensis]MBB5893060.1 methanogenic corrinoid protein MtbC1 [Kutzneria kofuensis]
MTPADRLDRLWQTVLAGDERAAVGAAFAALDDGLGLEDVLLEVIAPIQAKVGLEWAANQISVAQEHAATAINGRVIAALTRHSAARVEPRHGRITVACIDGEWHALPARLLSEVLRLRGWQVDFLGATVPTQHLIAHLRLAGPDAVALSSSVATRLPTAHATIIACQAAGIPVFAGGAAFGGDGRYAHMFGANVWAPNARRAADLLAGGLPRPKLAQPRQPVDDLPHLADHEYTLVARTARSLVRQTMADLMERLPAMKRYTSQQLDHTAADIAHIVDFLATALYTNSPELFAGFLRWTAEILMARGVPGQVLLPTLDVLAAGLKDATRASRLLKEVRADLDDRYPNWSRQRFR